MVVVAVGVAIVVNGRVANQELVDRILKIRGRLRERYRHAIDMELTRLEYSTKASTPPLDADKAHEPQSQHHEEQAVLRQVISLFGVDIFEFDCLNFSILVRSASAFIDRA